MSRPRPGRTAAAALALGAVLTLNPGCRCGGRRSVEAGKTRLADVEQASPEMTERLRAAGKQADTLLDVRGDALARLGRAAVPGRPRLPDDEGLGDRLATELATVTRAQVALLRAGVVEGLSGHHAFAWAQAVAAEEQARAGAPPGPWQDVRTLTLRRESGYSGRYTVAVRHLPVPGGAPLIVALAVRE